MDRIVFATGMFRSGTTLLARMLAAHEQVAFASDPFARLFKEFRNAVVTREQYGADFDPESPLDDYYYSASKLGLFDSIARTPLNLTTEAVDLAALRARIARHSRPFSPLIEPLLDRLDGGTFTDLFRTGFGLIREAYGDGSEPVVGFKDVWTGEFASHILEAFPAARVLYLVRDPRAVCASKNVKADKYPWLFLARQWRKLAAIAWHLRNDSAHADRVLVLRYEDLIENPAHWVGEICRFLGVTPSETLLDPSAFRNGSGEAWSQNSSHFSGAQAFNTGSVEKWRDVLSDEEIGFIEFVCGPEMGLFGYACEQYPERIGALANVCAPPYIAEQTLAGWIRPFVAGGEDRLVSESALEYVRHALIEDQSSLRSDQKRLFFLYEALFDHVQQISRHPA